MSEIDKAFGSAVKVRGFQLGISQESLAYRAGLHRTYISDIERRLKCPSLRVVIKLAYPLEIPAPDVVQMTEDHALCNNLCKE